MYFVVLEEIVEGNLVSCAVGLKCIKIRFKCVSLVNLVKITFLYKVLVKLFHLN